MKLGILDRYLLREAGGAWLAVTLVLMSIMLATRFARFLGEAATGILPRELLFKVVALSSLQYLVILIPVSLLLAIMLGGTLPVPLYLRSERHLGSGPAGGHGGLRRLRSGHPGRAGSAG